MRRSRTVPRGWLLAAALLLFSAARAFSLDPSLDVSQYAHTAWRVRDGFTRGMILAIAQTPDGYLWLGTDYGLARFDGVRAIPWEPPHDEQLPSNFISSLLVARDGTLWIGTKKGIASWKDGKLTNYREIAGRTINTLLEDHEGTIWAGEWEPPAEGRLCTIRQGAVECHSAFGPGVLSLYEDGKNNIWAGGMGGFWHWKPGPPKFYPVGTKENNVQSFAEDRDGGLLLAVTRLGIYRLVDGILRREYGFPNVHQGRAFYKMLRDQDGALWIASNNGGLLHVSDGRTDAFTARDGLSSDTTEAIFQDREGNVWVATIDGLDRFRNFPVPTWSVQQGLPFSPGSAVLAASDGSVWTGQTKGLGRLKDGQVTIYRRQHDRGGQRVDRNAQESIEPQLPATFAAFLQGRDGRIWVSSMQGRLGYVEDRRYHPITPVGTNTLEAIAEDSNGDLWVQERGEGLFRLHGERIVERFSWAELGRKREICERLAADPYRGGLWLACESGGITYVKDSHVRAAYSSSDGLGAGRVSDLQFGSRGDLWAATEGGLSRISDGHITTLTSKNGLPCQTVHWSMEDDEQFIWLYMACGLVRIAGSELSAWVRDPEHRVHTTVFEASDGVRTAARPTGAPPQVSKAPDGRIWFVTFDGLSVIDPGHLSYNKLPPPVHIEQIAADGKAYDAANGVRLPPLVRDLTIDYTALSLVVPEKMHFRFKLEGQDTDWREVVNDRQVQYSNLAPKHYRFLVKACNNSGVWNEEGAALDFVIPPAWYQTYWFGAVCVAAFLALLWAFYQYRLHQLARQFNMRLEERVGERTRIARDLHDTLLQSFHGILLFLQSGIHLLPDRPAEAKKTLKTAAEQAERAIIEGRVAVQGLRASTVERNDLAMAIKTLGGELAAADSSSQRPKFNVQVEGIPRELHPILRDEVYRIAGESMRNAFRHADATQIEVEIHYDERRLRVRVRDDGKGIDPKLLSHDGREGHFGLRGMRERAKLIGGKLTVWSELDSGTEVELSIPASRAYTVPDGQRSWLAEKLAKLSGKDTELKS